MAYRAIERQTLSDDAQLAAEADEAMAALLARKMARAEVDRWASREVEFQSLTDE